MRVLVVDDDDSVRSMLQMVFGLEGFEVDTAANGHEAMAALRADVPDVIVLDVMMPGMDGRQVAEAMAQDPDLERVPIVFCSALADAEDVWTGWQLGAASYVPKPFDNDELIREVLRVTKPINV